MTGQSTPNLHHSTHPPLLIVPISLDLHGVAVCSGAAAAGTGGRRDHAALADEQGQRSPGHDGWLAGRLEGAATWPPSMHASRAVDGEAAMQLGGFNEPLSFLLADAHTPPPAPLSMASLHGCSIEHNLLPSPPGGTCTEPAATSAATTAAAGASGPAAGEVAGAEDEALAACSGGLSQHHQEAELMSEHMEPGGKVDMQSADAGEHMQPGGKVDTQSADAGVCTAEPGGGRYGSNSSLLSACGSFSLDGVGPGLQARPECDETGLLLDGGLPEEAGQGCTAWPVATLLAAMLEVQGREEQDAVDCRGSCGGCQVCTALRSGQNALAGPNNPFHFLLSIHPSFLYPVIHSLCPYACMLGYF